jgi:hypothetical protein
VIEALEVMGESFVVKKFNCLTECGEEITSWHEKGAVACPELISTMIGEIHSRIKELPRTAKVIQAWREEHLANFWPETWLLFSLLLFFLISCLSWVSSGSLPLAPHLFPRNSCLLQRATF